MKSFLFLCSLGACALGGAQPLTLGEALRGASSRPSLEAARLRVDQANLTRRSFGAFPTTRLSLGYTSDPEVGGTDDDLVLSQPLDVFGRTSAARRVGDALVTQAEAELRHATLGVQSEVIEAYLSSVSASELVRTAIAAQETLQRLHAAIEQRVKEGVAPGVQLIRVDIDWDQAKLRVEQRQTELKASLRKLASLIGREDLSVPSGFPDLAPELADPAALQRQRADLLLLDANVRAADAEVRAAQLNGMPELEVQGRKTPWQERDDRFGVRVQLSIPIFDFGRVRSETKAAKAKADAARKAFEDASKVANGEVAAAQIELEAAKDQVGRYEKIADTARQLVERLRPALTEQATTLIEVLDATRALRDVEESLVESRSRLAQAQARYIKATGQLLEAGR